MILTYFRQAWQLLRQNKLFSTIYIVGTALAIASTTIFAIIYYARLAPVYPEYKRHQIYAFSTTYTETPDGHRIQEPRFKYNILTDGFYNLKSPELVSGYIDCYGLTILKLPNSERIVDVVMRMSDTAFFKIINFEFIAGAPFSQTDFESGSKKVTLSDRAAEKLFGNIDEAIGKTVTLDFNDYEVCGVYREGSALNELSFIQAIVPYTVLDNYKYDHYGALVLTDNEEIMNQEIDEYCRKYKSINDGLGIEFADVFRTATMRALQRDYDFDLMAVVRLNLLTLLALLLVPALNLSGMIAGRMENRQQELGIRKSFGASGGRLISQVLWENLFLTVIGGVIGFIITWAVMSCHAITLFTSIGAAPYSTTLNNAIEMHLTSDMIFAPIIFAFVFLICVVLNAMSALIPAWIALRKPIVKSLK